MKCIKRFLTEEELNNYIHNDNTLDKIYAIIEINRKNTVSNTQEFIQEFVVFHNYLSLSIEDEEQHLQSSASSIVAGYSNGNLLNVFDWKVYMY